MEKSSFFNSVNGDRKYKAEDFASFFGSFISNGIFPNPATNLKLVSNNDMTIILKAGKGWINGYYYENTDDLVLNIDVADGVLDRIDRIVLRLDYLNREIKTVVKKGTFASTPAAPMLKRDMDMYELGLADIKVRKGAISILQTDVLDTRLNLDLCGVTNSLITVDVGVITDKFSDDFTTWFETIKGQLSSDAAGNLFNMITETNNQLANKIDKTVTYDGALIDPNITEEGNILTSHANSPGSGYWYIQTYFYATNRSQIATRYAGGNPTMYIRYKYNGAWKPWIELSDKDLANTALQKANEKDFNSGFYLGNGAPSRTISLGFQPEAVLVFREGQKGYRESASSSTIAAIGGLALKGMPVPGIEYGYPVIYPSVLTVTATGFTVIHAKAGYETYQNTVNEPNVKYHYVVFK